jgi:hypothetical protein
MLSGMRARSVASSLAVGLLLCAGCGREPIEIIGAGLDGGFCPPSLAERLQVLTIPVEKNIAWQKLGYDRFPADERVVLAVEPSGQAQIAWGEVDLDSNGNVILPSPLGVHVTPLDQNLARRGPDTILPTAKEVSGLVAHDDGFAMLVRDDNPGTAIDNGDGATIAFLVRCYQNGQAPLQVPLTGSLSDGAAETQTVYSPFLEGQLVWNDSTYAAYFVVEGGTTDPSPGFWRDALVFRDSFLRPAPWTVVHGCLNNGGIRLIPDSNKANLVSSTYPRIPAITGLCVQQSRQAVKFTALEADRLVSDQEVQWSGYSGAKLGSLLKVSDGYLVFWLSLGANNDHQGHDIRMAKLDGSFNLVGSPSWVTRTPGVEEWNLHVVPYGQNHFLMVYIEIGITGPANSETYAMYLGNFVGTHLRLLDADGTPLTDEVVGNAPTVASAEPVVLSGGDVAWAFVNPSPDYTHLVGGPNGPGQTALHVVRVRYCE